MAASSATADVAEIAGIPATQNLFTAPLMYRVPVQAAVDGNTVDMDTERMAFAEQAVKHEFYLQKAIDQYKEISTLFKDMKG